MNLYDDLLARLKGARDEAEKAWITLEFNLSGQTESIRNAVWAASVPHWFDRRFLNALLDEPLDEEECQALTGLPYIEAFEGRGWNVHERSRELLRARLWDRDRARYLLLSRRAADYCGGRGQREVFWRAETLYHRLITQEEGAAEEFIGWSRRARSVRASRRRLLQRLW